MRSSLFRLNAFALLVILGFSSNARANLYKTIWDLTGNFTVGSGDYIQVTDSFLYQNGYFAHNDSTIDVWGNAQIGGVRNNGWGVFYQNGGQINVGGYLSIARYSGSGYLEVNGGGVNAYNHQIIVGEEGDGTMTLNNNGWAYSLQGVALGQNISAARGSLNLNGGTLHVGAIWKGNGTGNLSFNGGTLRAAREEWYFISGLSSANIYGNGAVIDNYGYGIGINQTLAGSASGSVKFDGGNWTTLRQNNTYTGDTLVRGGVLNFYESGSLYNNGTAAGNIYVNSGATLFFNRDNVFGNADTGSFSPVSITLNGGTINNGNGGVTGGGVFNNLANLAMNGGTLMASGGSSYGWNAYELNNVTVGGTSASTITSNTSNNNKNDILLSRAGTTTFNVGSTGDATGDLKVSAKLTDGNGVVGSLTKTGPGKMVLSAANTYTGETKVLAGTLVVDTGGSVVSSSTTISSGATLQGAGSIAALTVKSGGVVKITTASTSTTSTTTTSTSTATAWDTGGSINFNSGSIIDVTGLTLSQQSYVLIRGSSVTGTPTVQGATGLTVSNTGNSITLTPTYTYTIANGQATITGYTGTGGNVVIPVTIGGFPVTKIGDNAFSFRTTLTNITIPDSVLQIGQNAFYGCSGLQTASIGNGVTTLPRNTFSECVGLTSVSLSANVITLGDYAFNNCKKLTSITFPTGFQSMGTRAFALCAELTSIAFPQSVTAIGSEAFYGCAKLATVYFQGNTPPAVEWGAFNGIANGAKGYYPSTASTAWRGITTYNDLTIVHPDTESPVITLIGANLMEIYKGATFSDPGATVTDNKDATRTINGTGTVNAATVGIYTLTYAATDAAGNLALPVARTVNVVLDPSGDEDGDGLTNAQELTLGTNAYQKDSDNDGVNDSKELADGTNPTDASSYKSLSKGLVVYYQFSGNANDSSGNGNNGIPVSPVLSVDRLGAANAAYTFNGTTDRINLSNSAALNMNNGVPFSMSAWIKTDFSEGQRVILAKAAGAWGNTPALFVDSEGKLRFDNFYINEVHSSATVRTGTWMHVAVTYDGSTYRLYVNGVADGEKAFTGSNESGNSWTFSIGGSLNTSFPSGMFKGSIDEVQFWSRTLSPAEVAGVVQASSAPANRAPVIAGQSTTYDALAEFVAGPTLQSANSRWQYLGGNASALTLLGNWKTTGNEIIQNQPQWDGNSGYLSNYPFVQRVSSATGPTSANTLVIHPSNLEEAKRAVAIGWKNTSSQTVAANFNVNLRLPYGSANGIDYKLQRGLAGSSRYLSIRSGSLQAGDSVALASDALLEMQTGEMLYLIVDSKNNFEYDHTEVSAFTVTVAGGASLDSISEGVASANNPGTAVTVLTATSSDADSDALKGIAITGVDTSHGSWEYTLNGGNVWNSLSGVGLSSALLLKSDGQHRVRFVPTANFSGNAEIRYRAWDQTSGEDGALADLTGVGGGAWVLVAYGAQASLGGSLTAASGSFSSSGRTGSAVLPGSMDILKNSMELAMTWTASGGSFPSGGIGSYTHGIAFALPNAAGMSFDGSATSPLIYYNGNSYNPLDSSFAVGSSSPDQSLVNVRTLVGSPGMPSQMYLRNKTFGAGYGGVYGLVMNNGSNPQLDYGQVPDGQTFKAVYLDHGTGAAQGQGLVMGGAGGAQNSYVPSTMAIWARLDSLQLLALSGNSSVTGSGNYLLGSHGTTYIDVIDFSSSGAFSANTATGTIHVLDASVPVITLIGANSVTIYKGSFFTDLGATVTDNVDATRGITGSGTVNTGAVGIYTLTYTATDAAGNLAVPVTRTVNVVLDPAEDEDGDGATNEVELTIGTNPYDSASGPYQPVANVDAFTAKLATGMTTKVTTASLISNDKYSGIPAETRGVTFQGAATTSTKGATIQVKAGWLIYRPSSSAQNGTSDTFTYTVSNGIKTATGTVTVYLVSPEYVAQVAIDRVSGDKVYFSVMPGMTFEVQGTSQLGTAATWTTVVGPNNGYWTSGADGRLIVTDPAAIGAASRFYQFRWIP